ncbi:MAG TPA: hypothetical protein VI322_04920 [Candidatus Saccharimonadia bacterium]
MSHSRIWFGPWMCTKPRFTQLAKLVPTQHYDGQLVRETADTLDRYRDLSTRVLLMGGNKSPRFLQLALDGLEAVLPHCQ